MNNGPLPTRIVFLSDLPTQAHGTKVRFLGCVTRYTFSTGVLELQHAYHLPPNQPTVALVDVNVILEGLEREDTQVGAWVNVLGYVEEVLEEGKRERGQGKGKTGLAKRKGDRIREGPRAGRVRVRAVVLWSAGGVKIGEYERTLEERLELDKGSREGDA
ncbi:hypothetical protein HO133_005933 [Letharia lupina]|uniref:Uncharacterized protein n=1 Tax=Letharia lupina TaxID=560253 RepID=A0A8H6C7V3_9LECA|nr:uncharacterized protein HO133_005933 [Letharia lupina]KAF6218582.1 hypothetical protein HO133_005933 [Letharia lupina]